MRYSTGEQDSRDARAMEKPTVRKSVKQDDDGEERRRVAQEDDGVSMRVQNLVEDELVTSPEVTVGKKEERNCGDAERIEDGVAETSCRAEYEIEIEPKWSTS